MKRIVFICIRTRVQGEKKFSYLYLSQCVHSKLVRSYHPSVIHATLCAHLGCSMSQRHNKYANKL